MADTQRTRAALLALYADNVTGQISPQDLRDGFVTIMNPEFAYEGDFWKQPDPYYLTKATNADYKGWVDYSQVMGSAISRGCFVALAPSGFWAPANVSVLSRNYCLGLAISDYPLGAISATILRRGIFYCSEYSRFSNFLGQAIYIQSDSTGSISITTTTFASRYIGVFEPHSHLELNTGISRAIPALRFDPSWGVAGA